VYIELDDHDGLKKILGREDAACLDRLSRCPLNKKFGVGILHKLLCYKSELIGQDTKESLQLIKAFFIHSILVHILLRLEESILTIVM